MTLPSNKQAFDALMTKLDAATSGYRDLDIEIARWIGYTIKQKVGIGGVVELYMIDEGTYPLSSMRLQLPIYSSSVDDALSLVKQEAIVQLRRGVEYCYCEIDDSAYDFSESGKTLALAIVKTALWAIFVERQNNE